MAIIIGPDTNRFFISQSTLQVLDDVVAYADDVNSLTQKTNTAFDNVQYEMDTLAGTSGLARKWATDPQGTKPEPTVDDYSAKAYALEAKSWGNEPAGQGIKLADGTIDFGFESSKFYTTFCADSAAAADASAIAAKASEDAALVSENAADLAASNAQDSETAAKASEDAAALSESASLASENKAYKWAQEAEDVEVDPGEYSAYHWSLKAAAVAGPVVFKTSDTGAAIMPKGLTAERDGAPLSGYLRFNTELVQFEGFDGVSWGGIGGGIQWFVITGNTTAIANAGYMINVQGGPVTLQLPGSPIIGQVVGVEDQKGSANLNNITIDGQGHNIMNLPEDLLLDIDYVGITLTYSDASAGWVITDGAW